MKGSNTPEHRQAEDYISLTDFWYLCIIHIRWFTTSLVVCMSFAVYYLAATPNMYTREAAVLVKQESQGKSIGRQNTSEEFGSIGLVQQNINVNNVERSLTSLNVIMDVVQRLHLAQNQDVVHEAENIQKRLKAEISDEKSTIINLKYVDTSINRAEAVLNTLVQVYNEQWVNDKNEIVINTSRFITERLKLIEEDLNNVDDSISAFKSRHKITDLESVSDLYLQQLSKSDADIMRLNNEEAMAQYIRRILVDKSNSHQLLPSGSGINDQVTETQINQYNNLLLQLNSHLAYTSDQNPLIINQEQELATMRSNIVHSIDNLIEALNIQLQTLQGYSGDASSKIISNPEQAKHLISVERQQKVKESLYLYMLQKLEENEISMTYTSYNTQLIDIPHGSDVPTSPNNRNILCAAFILALLFPASILFMRENLDNTIRTRDELEHKTTLPLIGEIPFYVEDNEIKRLPRRFWPKDAKLTKIVVEMGSQNIVNEAFRIIRSNLEFMTDESLNKDNIYVITSNYPGSGKTFVSMNLAAALAIKEKRVLLIDGDLRHASVSRFWKCNNDGISNCLSGKEDDPQRLIVPIKAYQSLDLLPVGIIPPNPTELLSNNRLHEMLEKLRPHYDYIFIDCPPIDTLADAGIIGRHADRTLLVIRAGLFERKRIAELESDYLAGKHSHTSLILNCTGANGRNGYKYGYKNRYNKYGETIENRNK